MADDVKQPTRVQTAFGLQAIPHEKWYQMVVRTFIGFIILMVGIGVLGVSGYVVIQAKSITLLAAIAGAVGVVLVMVAATVWSSQIIGKAIKSLAKPAETIKALLKKDA